MPSTLKRIRQSQEDVRLNRCNFKITLAFTGRPTRTESMKRSEWTTEQLTAYVKRAVKDLLSRDEIDRVVTRLKQCLNSPNEQYDWNYNYGPQRLNVFIETE